MDTLLEHLTVFGRFFFVALIITLAMSGVWYWWQRLMRWLREPKPLHKMNERELRAFIAGIMRPSDVAAKNARLHCALGDQSLILSASVGEAISSFIMNRHPGLNGEAEARVNDAAKGIAETIHLGNLARTLGSVECDCIVTELRRIADVLPLTEDAETIRSLIELIKTANELNKLEQALAKTR